MQRRFTVCVILITLLLSTLPVTAETSGRAGDNCAEVSLASMSTAVAIDGQSCVVVPLGELTPQSIWTVDMLIIDDEIDALFFDGQGILPYDLDQSYRSSYQSAPSTEFAIGEFEFDWMVPASISPKSWFLILDNKAHSGDQGEGDQGGNRSRVSLTFNQVTSNPNTIFHDLVDLQANQSIELVSGSDLILDAGTTVQVNVNSLQGSADLLVQTESINTAWNNQSSASASISGQSILGIQGQSSLQWTVTEDYSNQPLYIVLDNSARPSGGSDPSERSRTTVQISIVPILNPVITLSQSSIPLGQELTIDALLTANLSGQVIDYRWDFDSSNGDSNRDASGLAVSNSWNSPGNYTVTLEITASDNRVTKTSTQVMVTDVTSPVPTITSTGSGTPVNEGYILNVGNAMELSCSESTDDHMVESCAWRINGNYVGMVDEVVFNYSSVVDWTVELTVFDSWGNSANITTIVSVVDTSDPVLNSASTSSFVKVVTAGESFTYSVSASDSFDDNDDLRYHWDIDAARDSDGNGNKLDDPDFTGSSFSTVFEETGKYDFTVTVFDASNNSDSYSWRVTVQNSASLSNYDQLFPAIGALLGLLVVIGLISRFRSRRKQRSSEPVTSSMSQEEIEQKQKEEQMKQIYGSVQQPEYAQQAIPQMSQASSQAVNSAANDLFTEREQTTSSYSSPIEQDLLSSLEQTTQAPVAKTIEDQGSIAELNSTTTPKTEASNKTTFKSGGVTLPQMSNNEISDVQNHEQGPTRQVHECSNCGQQFAVKIPVGTPKVKANCPSCGTSQIISRN